MAALVLATLSVQPPLLTAVAATLVFAGISLAYGRRPGAAVGPVPGRLPESLAADAMVLVIVGAVTALIGRAVGTGAAFYCEPLVPWRIEIALFGSFAVAYFTAYRSPSPAHGFAIGDEDGRTRQ